MIRDDTRWPGNLGLTTSTLMVLNLAYDLRSPLPFFTLFLRLSCSVHFIFSVRCFQSSVGLARSMFYILDGDVQSVEFDLALTCGSHMIFFFFRHWMFMSFDTFSIVNWQITA